MSDQKNNVETRELRFEPPATDIYETGDGITLLADMPGVDKETLDLTVERSTLTITGKLRPRDMEGFELAYSEYSADGYRRSFTVSDEFDLAKIRARYENGVLAVSIPKSESAMPKRIKVNM